MSSLSEALTARKPAWLKVGIPAGPEVAELGRILARRGLHTVCDEARCPNKGECWSQSTATFMVMGAVCTRGCRFCAVATARQGQPLDDCEPEQLADAVAELGLRWAVVTSVDRDDLADRGAAHFAACVLAIKSKRPETGVEVLAPDYQAGEIEALLAAQPDVYAHNLETVRRLQVVRDARAGWDKSLASLRLAAAAPKRLLVKSSLLLGLGESQSEIEEAMDSLLGAGVDILVMGQYLQPTSKQLPVQEYLPPERFAELAALARAKGFRAVVSSPLARTSYHAREAAELR